MLADWLRPKGAFTRLSVEVTFLEMCSSPGGVALPEGYTLSRSAGNEALQLYRSLYEGVGQAYCWWMRRAMPDARLGAILSNPNVYFMVLRGPDAAVAGFYELDLENGDANLSYFGLLPHALGRGLGRILLDHAIAHAFSAGSWRLRVNTCTLDHPRALPNYLKAGFEITSVIPEIWDVPNEYLPEEFKRL